MLLRHQVLSYGLVGAFNTILTAAVIGVLVYLSFQPVLVNAVGFSAGLLSSYLLNSNFTFRGKRSSVQLAFFLAFCVAYSVNLVVLLLVQLLGGVGPYIPQGAGMVSYNVAFFILMKFWVFVDAAETE